MEKRVASSLLKEKKEKREERTGIFPSVSMTRTKWTRHGKRDSIPDEGDAGRHQLMN
jgi:hypothetical protein